VEADRLVALPARPPGARRVPERDEELPKQPRELLALSGRQPFHGSPLDRAEDLDGPVGDIEAGRREADEDAAAIVRIRGARDEAGGLEAVDSMRDGSGGEQQSSSKGGRGQAVRGARPA